MHEEVAQWRCSTSTPESAEVCGWDLGGAHLKAVGLRVDGSFLWALQCATPLWQGLGSLQQGLQRVATMLRPDAAHVLTLTGEAADCFPDRTAGVHALVALWQGEFPGVRAWLQTGADVPVPLAAMSPEAVAAAGALNFLATGHLCARLGLAGVVADMGSTTTDLLVVQADGVQADGVQATAVDDAGRLASGELVYQGLTRTPLMVFGPRVPFAGRWQSLMNEHFATTADVHRLAGMLEESTDLHPAADGGEKTPRGSARRIARMVGHDLDAAPIECWQQLALWFMGQQRRELADALALIGSRHPRALANGLIVTGIGAKVLARVARDLGLPCEGLAARAGSDAPGSWIERCTPAWAAARLLSSAPHEGRA